MYSVYDTSYLNNVAGTRGLPQRFTTVAICVAAPSDEITD